MVQRQADVPPPFDQGVFLMHYNKGREAFQEGRYAEARRSLEIAQRHRPDDSDVLNLLGLVYFKTSAFAEAEVIYRRLAAENPGVFILHSNLGLILFKQGKLDEAEEHLSRSIELRPNYAKSHLYLGLLYKQKKKFGLALEHLRFAGAEKAVREVEALLRVDQPPVKPPEPPKKEKVDTATTGRFNVAEVAPPVGERTERDLRLTQPGRIIAPSDARDRSVPPVTQPGHQAEIPMAAARKLQEAVDESSVVEDKRLDLGRKIEGASRTFVLHENGFLEINLRKSVHVKRGTVSSYSGNLKFAAESILVGTTAQTLVKAVGEGKIFAYEKGKKTFLLDLNDEFIYVEGANLLALEDSLAYRVEPIYDTSYQKKIDTVKIFGRGSLAISTSIEPLILRVTRQFPLSISSSSLVAWTGNLIASVLEDRYLSDVMIEASAQSFKIRFDGDGIVVSEQ